MSLNNSYGPYTRSKPMPEEESRPLTPQPQRRQLTDEELINETLSDIARTTSKIDEISAENAQAHIRCMKLQHTLASVTKALEKNIDCIQKVCEKQEAENARLREAVSKKVACADKIQALINKCANAGIDVYDIPGLDHDTLAQYFDIPEPVDFNSRMDPMIRSIASSYPVFKQCESNKDFINKCREIKAELEKAEEQRKSRKTTNDPNEIMALRKQLALLQQSNSATQARMAKELNILLEQKSELKNKLDGMRKLKQSHSAGSSMIFHSSI
ncbi:hypothetical protein TVAG_386010 [Trichomonas vaginalis G3]|uniref:Uncharacterized protein n=1 Tax=Trichomonas vaginalis (strain ATCC PRA-98 / G3) TaxID=412133 RepID=A2FZP0_TRIV3|nr:hypothetical protein TVAGG3_0249050 [Trichomonas vaginalis G3]EAX89631.1 hypothetical protein TVAG_386010 [Trichomonas vaginalis G3]KAI5553864.1 hypothetical protein TVAGG3_0249050 [Trichomonas vaginalis G3]|eukprot:XP_001302561.1 hypothetical protein [Trichomonas vaginalis G3]